MIQALNINAREVSELDITPSDVLRGQGADPEIIKTRSPKLYDLAAKALDEGRELLNPAFLIKESPILEIRHEKIILENNLEISGPMIVQHLSSAQFLVAVLCTIGEALDDYVSRMSSKDLVEALAFDGLGSAAVEALANTICHDIETKAAMVDLETTIPLSPGMVRWPVEQGQPQLFEILKPSKIGVELTPDYLMKPRKSLSMIIGVGQDLKASGTTCDYCSMRETCRYRENQSSV